MLNQVLVNLKLLSTTPDVVIPQDMLLSNVLLSLNLVKNYSNYMNKKYQDYKKATIIFLTRFLIFSLIFTILNNILLFLIMKR